MSGNRTYGACYLSAGERALVTRALKHFIHDQHVMIQEAHAKDTTKDRVRFEDSKQHHLKQVDAANNLIDRFRNNTVTTNPENKT